MLAWYDEYREKAAEYPAMKYPAEKEDKRMFFSLCYKGRLFLVFCYVYFLFFFVVGFWHFFCIVRCFFLGMCSGTFGIWGEDSLRSRCAQVCGPGDLVL